MPLNQTAIAPYDPLDMRRRLDLRPGRTDPVSMLLFSAIYSAQSVEDFENSVEASISDLQKALAIVRSGGQS